MPVSEKNLNTTWLINAKRKEVEGRTGLRFSWVKTSEELTGVLKEGLTELYQQVYADPPYNEAFSPEDVRKVFKETLSAGGLILTAASPDDGRTVAFITSVPMAAAEPLVSDVINAIIPPGTASYFSEEGVARDWRRRGLSTNMKDLLLTANFLSGFENIVLRTSVYNYPQIAAINKSGGIVIPNLFQNVESRRGDGSIITDKRAFYLFNREWTDQAENLRILNRVTIVRPGGNDTAIVWDHIQRKDHSSVSLRIQQTYPEIEQVMFIEPLAKASAFRSQMAGGEFCGNATRSLGYLMLGSKDGKIEVEVSGAIRPLTVEVRDGLSRTQIPILNDLNCVKPIGDTGEYMVRLEGISFLITFVDVNHGSQVASLNNLEQKKKRILEILNEYRLSEWASSGLLVLSRKENGDLHLDPFVYVKDTGTLCYESGCCSGSAAVGLMLAKQSGSSVSDQKIVQPNGMDLYVSVDRDDRAFISATVNGPIEILFDGKMYLYRGIEIQKTENVR